MIDAMKQALEWANEHGETVFFGGGIDAVNKMNEWTAALRQAIEQAEKQEPVAYLCENAVGHKYFRWKKPTSHYKPIALYTAPPRKEWVGLTEDEIHKIIDDCTPDDAAQEELNDFARAVHFAEAKLKEKNGG